MPNEVGGTFIPVWVAIIGLIGILGTPTLAFWFEMRRRGRVEAQPAILPASNQHGFTSVDIHTMIRTIHELQNDLVVAIRRIEALESHDAQKDSLLSQAVYWGTHAPGDPPRVPPEHLRPFIDRDVR